MRKSEKHLFHVTCAPGLENALVRELEELGVRHPKTAKGVVRFKGSLRAALQVLLWTRIGSRVLVELVKVQARNSDELYDEVLHLPWEDRLTTQHTFSIEVIGTSETLRHTHYTGQRIKDAICDRFREDTGVRPSVERFAPDVTIVAHLHRGQCTLSLDLAGERLHRRGYREVTVAAPLKENLAAGILHLSGWDRESPLVDPMCGGGTLVIEGAMWATRIAPGETLRPACLNWPWRGEECAEIWSALTDEAGEGALEDCPAAILAKDKDGKALDATRTNARKAGVLREIQLEQGELKDLVLPQGPGWIVTNPPYGERLDTREEAEKLMRQFRALWEKTEDYHLAIIAPWSELPEWLGDKPTRKVPLRNGKIDAYLYVFSPRGMAE